MKLILFTSPDHGRSAIAAAFFNALVDPTAACGLAAVPDAPGLIESEAAAVMVEMVQEIVLRRPSRLTPELVAVVDRWISLDIVPNMNTPHVADRICWHVADPRGKSRAEVLCIREDILAKVERFVADNGWLKK
jgi:arsenate reductase (thioredoxin)